MRGSRIGPIGSTGPPSPSCSRCYRSQEVLGVHSQATKVLRQYVSITEGFGYMLVLGAIGLVVFAIVAIVFWRFYLHLPSRWRTWFVIAAVIYLVGVLASDMVGDRLRTDSGDATLAYIVALTIEEALEMTGVLIVIALLLDYIRTVVGRAGVEVRDASGLAGRTPAT